MSSFLFCFFFSLMTVTEGGGVERREVGGQINIHCRPPKSSKPEYLSLARGLETESQMVYVELSSKKETVNYQLRGRVQANTIKKPEVDFLIFNLTQNDTGIYWCKYETFDTELRRNVVTKGSGSVLLVVTAAAAAAAAASCDQDQGLVLVSVLMSASVLLAAILAGLIWLIIKRKTSPSEKPRRVATNDVYEEMRGTIRR